MKATSMIISTEMLFTRLHTSAQQPNRSQSLQAKLRRPSQTLIFLLSHNQKSFCRPETHGSIFGLANTFRITFELTGLRDFSRRPGGMMGLGKDSIQTRNDCCLTAVCQRNRHGGSAKGNNALTGWGRLFERGFGGCTGHGPEWAISGSAFSG